MASERDVTSRSSCVMGAETSRTGGGNNKSLFVTGMETSKTGGYEGCWGSSWNLVIKCSNIDIVL